MQQLKKPFTQEQKDFFISVSNKLGQRTVETNEALYSLEDCEIMGKKDIEIDVLEFVEVEIEEKSPVFDEEGNPQFNEDGTQKYKTEKKKVNKPVFIEIEKEFQEPQFDDEGAYIGDVTKKVKTKIQKSHKERITIDYPIPDPDFEQKIIEKKREALSNLSLTKREVFLALYEAKGITPDEVKAQIDDPAQLIEFEYANEYYRGNPLVDLIGAKLGYSTDDLNYLFINHELPNKEVENDKENQNV